MKAKKRKRLIKTKEEKKKALSKWRDRQKCQECGSEKNLTVHHKTPKSCGGLDRSWNYEVLCRGCHGKEHKEDA